MEMSTDESQKRGVDGSMGVIVLGFGNSGECVCGVTSAANAAKIDPRIDIPHP